MLAFYNLLKMHDWDRGRASQDCGISRRLATQWVEALRNEGVPVPRTVFLIDGHLDHPFGNKRRNHAWVPGEIKYLTQSWDKIPLDKILFVLGRRDAKVIAMAERLGLKRETHGDK